MGVYHIPCENCGKHFITENNRKKEELDSWLSNNLKDNQFKKKK